MIRYNKLLLCLLLALTGTSSIGVYAQQLPPEEMAPVVGMLDSVHSIADVVVTIPRRHPEIIPVQTLAGEKLTSLGALSVADAVRYFSGVQLKDYGGVGGLKTVNVRSMGSNHVGVYYDGVKVSNAQNGVVDLGRFSLDNLEAVSLYNGQKSAIFQPAADFASSSSIYLTTKTPVFRDDKRYNIKTSLSGGSFGLVNPSVLWEQRLSDKISSSLSTSYLYSNGKYKFTDEVINAQNPEAGGYKVTETRTGGDVSTFRAEHALSGKIERGEWKTRAYAYLSQMGLPGAVVRRTTQDNAYQGRQWDRSYFMQASLRKALSSNYFTQITGKYSYDYIHYVSKTGPSYDNRYKVQQVYLSSANYISILPWWSVNVSADLQWEKMTSDIIQFVYPTRYTAMVAAATSLELGKLKLHASLLVTYTRDKLGTGEPVTPNSSRYTPSLVLSWQPISGQDLFLRGFYKRVFRMPTFNEMYMTTIATGMSNLRPENTEQFDVGLTWSRSFGILGNTRIEIQADGYYNEVKDKLIAVPGNNMFRWSMINLGLVKIWGLDAALSTSTRPSDDWRVDTRFSYTWQKARDYTYPDAADPRHITYKGIIAYVPDHSGSAVATVGYRTWELNYSFIYTGSRFTQSDNKPENRVKEWYTSDLALSKTFDWGGRKARFSAEVNNIFNQQYDVVLNYPMPGTNVRLSASLTF